MSVDPAHPLRRSARPSGRVAKPLTTERLAQIAEEDKARRRRAEMANNKAKPEWWVAEQAKLDDQYRRKSAELAQGHAAAIQKQASDDASNLFGNMRMSDSATPAPAPPASGGNMRHRGKRAKK